MNNMISIEARRAGVSPPSEPLSGWPVLRLGFRPFYLGAAAFAVIAVPWWIVLLYRPELIAGTWAEALQPNLPPLLWHAHEMLFGFVAAVIMGFLLTAVRAWTGLSTPRGVLLGALIGLWLVARLTALEVIGVPYVVYAVLDLALIPLVALLLLRVVMQAGNRRNYPIIGLLLLLSLANLAFHLAYGGWWSISPLRPLYGALAIIVLIECVMAGRVVPAFTQSAIPGLRLVQSPRLEVASFVATALALASWVLDPPLGAVTPVLLALAAALQLARWLQWRPWVTRTRPILWILHLGYLWIPLGLALLACARLGWISQSAGIHGLAIGATGGLIIGMITRTARGHTGRPLQVGYAEIAAYVLIMSAALLRTLLPLGLPPDAYVALLWAAVAAWSVAFALYLWRYVPWLMTSRLDGKDG